MKKVILSLFVVGSLMATACKNAKEAEEKAKEVTETVVEKTEEATKTVEEKTEEATKIVEEKTEEAVKTIQSALEGITIPEFEDPKVAEHLKSYAEYAKKYIEAGGDVVKNVDLAKTGTELAAKSKEIVANLDEEATKKFNSTLNAILAKMAPAK
ncbi:hypothetical protein EV195_101637 [Tenacibaculum skagerrakense]|uniref:Lipoprotein n=1 Tax=Tenacibaculum skagerrakense TaxID=186571 RepID=A0A4R2P1B0_9FLAO|nr:hypothetical protein [Tenacibaculum skagerrakense]TCP28459.1 hypothetical protein EV195_101637 [Tenacibaculum skagerrakense]